MCAHRQILGAFGSDPVVGPRREDDVRILGIARAIARSTSENCRIAAILLVERRHLERSAPLGAVPKYWYRFPHDAEFEIGRASCRERVFKYVSISVVALALNKILNTNMMTHQAAQSSRIPKPTY